MAISKIAGFLRGLLGRGEKRAPAQPAAPAPTQAAGQKSQKRGVPPPPAKPGAGRPAATPAKAPPPPAAKPVAKSAAVPAAKPTAPPAAKPVVAAPVATGEEIELPLAPIVASLPADLRAKLMSNPAAGQTIRLPAEVVLQQLAFGAVRISFGELRGLAPGLFLNSGGELDIKQVNLPLQEILSRVNPTLLARRSVRKVEVADDIVGPFAERGRGFSFTTQPLKSASTSPQAREPEPSLSATPPAARQVAPLPATNLPPPPQRPVTPATPPPQSQPLQSRTPLPPPSSLRPAAAPGGNGHGTALPPGLKLAGGRTDHPSAPKPSMPAHGSSAPPPPTIHAPLGELCESWPEDLKHAILESPLARTNVPLDGGLIMPGLKRGRVVMTWKQLRMMAQPTSAASPWDALELELPLKVIAPLFMAAQKPGPKAPTKTVSTEIPDLFFGFPQPSTPAVVTPAATVAPAPAAKAAPTAPAPAPAPAPVVTVAAPAPKPAEAKPKETNFYSRSDRAEMAQGGEAAVAEAGQTDFTTRQAHPKDVVGRAAALPGVAGSVVAMQDGLRVASQVPTELNADTLAAFLPQIFDRLNHSTRELRMGPLNNISFTVGPVPWRVFRVNSVYFAAFGRAGESLPVVQLVQLAEELDRKKQQ